MVISRQITLSEDEIFQAIKEYVDNHANGLSGSEVCNFRIHFEDSNNNHNPYMKITLEDKRL